LSSLSLRRPACPWWCPAFLCSAGRLPPTKHRTARARSAPPSMLSLRRAAGGRRAEADGVNQRGVTRIRPFSSEASTVRSGDVSRIGSTKGLGGDDGSSPVRSVAHPCFPSMAGTVRCAAPLAPICHQPRIERSRLNPLRPKGRDGAAMVRPR
jgi:hypothetical protein